MIEDKSKHFQNKLYEMSNYFECLKHLIDKNNFPKVLMLNGKKGQIKLLWCIIFCHITLIAKITDTKIVDY